MTIIEISLCYNEYGL